MDNIKIDKIKNSKGLIAAAAFIILAAVGVLFYFQSGLFFQKDLTREQAAVKALNFIDQSIDEGLTANLIEATDEGQVYGLHLEIGGTEYQSYITKDGKFLFPNGFTLNTPPDDSQNNLVN